jgi:N-acetylglucosaminyldiphosphoundecaprenol N-acetyl-beta-D-mannosaminyltransferase
MRGQARQALSSNRAAVSVRPLFGVDVAAVTMSEAIALIALTIETRKRLQIGVVNAAKLVNMTRQPALREAVLTCDVVFADGMAVVWASRLLGQALPERVTGIDLMDAILARGDERGWRVYCLGAEPEVLAAALAAFGKRHPGVQFVGSHHGYFSADEERAVVAAIAAARPDVLLVGMTSPRKEQFIARWNDHLQVPVCHGVGGSFDIAGGKVRRAPLLWQRSGLEWLYRVVQEPRRLWRRYLITNVLFTGMVLQEAARRFTHRAPEDFRRA